MLFAIGFFSMMVGLLGILPGLVIATADARRWQTSESSARVAISLALLSDGMMGAVTCALAIHLAIE